MAGRTVAGSQSALVSMGAGAGSSTLLTRSGSRSEFGTPEVLGMSVGFERPTIVQEQLELEGAWVFPGTQGCVSGGEVQVLAHVASGM